MPQTDAIFANVQAARTRTADEPDALRISIDCKAKVKAGDFSRGGSARGAEAVKALDHDMGANAVPVPFGALEVNRGAVPVHQPWFLSGHSRQTSDFLVDGLDRSWSEQKAAHVGVKRLHIELDNGPESSGSRTQFLSRMVGFADRHQVTVELAYLPPRHSEYNPVERCWGIPGRHRNGALLGSVTDVLRWAGSMTWRGSLRSSGRQRWCTSGGRLAKAAFAAIAERLIRSSTLPKWSLTIPSRSR
ncbi:MAG: ISAzo13-like element transposase-related protein [Gemmataceae bacterium]